MISVYEKDEAEIGKKTISYLEVRLFAIQITPPDHHVNIAKPLDQSQS